MRRLQYSAEEDRRVHQLDRRRPLRRPTAHLQQGSQTTCVEMVDFGNVQDEQTDTFELLDPAPECVERGPTHHASRAVHNRYVLQAFDFKFEFHMLIHTNLLWKKFRAGCP